MSKCSSALLRKLIGTGLLLSMTGCASIGNIEALNDLGHTGKTIGSTARVITSSCVVLTGTVCGATANGSAINHTYGQLKQLPYHIQHSNNRAIAVSEILDVAR